MKKGQTVELLGFLLLVVVVVIVFLTINYLTAGKKLDVMELTQESQDISYFNSGANTFSALIEPAANKTFIELIGLAGFFEKSVLEFGPADNKIQVNVFNEATKRLDLIYGKGHWHMDIHPAPPYEMYVIILLDVSQSMDEEITNIQEKIGTIITDVKKTTGKRVFYKLYFLPGGDWYKAKFNDAVKKYPNLKTYSVTDCTLNGEKNEAWAQGMDCLIEKKAPEWGTVTAKVGIILSDEPPGGCEKCGCWHYGGYVYEGCCPNDYLTTCSDVSDCGTRDADISALITRANSLMPTAMNIYTLKANPCNVLPAGPQCNYAHIPYVCAGEQKLIDYMTTLSTGTGAKMYNVDNHEDVSKAIQDIVLAQPIPDVPFEFGTTPPEGKVIHSYVIPAPTPVPGAYVKVVLKQWN